MGQQVRRAGMVSVIVFGVASVLTTGPASAATSHATGTVVHLCNFPMIGQQPLDITVRFDSPGPVAADGSFTPAAIAGTATFNAIHNATIFSAANYDGLRGADRDEHHPRFGNRHRTGPARADHPVRAGASHLRLHAERGDRRPRVHHRFPR